MLYELEQSDFSKVRALFEPLAYNLALGSILAGKTPARVYVDDPAAPVAVFTGFKHRLFLAGSPQQADFNQAVYQLLQGTIIPQAQAAGQQAFILHTSAPEWEAQLEVILAGMSPLHGRREYYACTRLNEDWRRLLPPGFTLLPVTARLVAQAHLENLDALREELCSERASVEDFLEKSFGFCLVTGDELAGWCLSEYNQAGRCEVGVATVEKYQRRGLGTIVTLALVEHALSRGYRHIGWHCWAKNKPSSALALRAGFEFVRDYPVYLYMLREIM